MSSIFQSVAAFVAVHHVWAAPVLGLITLLESLVVLGAFVPATALLVMAGGLVAAGSLDLGSVLVWSVAGAFVGDAVSFGLGRRFGREMLVHPALKNSRRVIARTRLFTRRYGVASIFLGRFLGPLRAFIPVALGILRMRRGTFQAANLVSAAVWVLAMLAPGYFAAKGIARLEALADADAITIAIICTVAAGGLGYLSWRLLRRRLTARKAAALVALNGVVQPL